MKTQKRNQGRKLRLNARKAGERAKGERGRENGVGVEVALSTDNYHPLAGVIKRSGVGGRGWGQIVLTPPSPLIWRTYVSRAGATTAFVSLVASLDRRRYCLIWRPNRVTAKARTFS